MMLKNGERNGWVNITAPKLSEGYSHVLKIDDREPAKFVEMIVDNCTIPVEIVRMKTGDYVCEDVGIERKKLSDFVGSFTSGKKRLWKQCDRMKKEFKYPYVVISNKTTEIDSMVSEHAIIGAIAALATPTFYPNGTVASPGMSVVKVDSDEQLAYLILKIFSRHKKLSLPSELVNI